MSNSKSVPFQYLIFLGHINMGSVFSSHSKRKPTTSSGFLGRDRMVRVREAFLCYYKIVKFAGRLHMRDMATIEGQAGFELRSL